MTRSRAEDPGGVALLLWGVRTLGWLLLACVVGGALLLPQLTATKAPTFQATALVVARQLAVKAFVLPPLAEAVFYSDAMAGRVADAVAAEGTGDLAALAGDGSGASGLIPDRIGLVAAQDSIVLVVYGRADSPEPAARLADIAAAAFADELNRVGSGVGTFAVSGRADLPTAVADDQGPPVSLMATAGGSAGLLVGFGLLRLVAASRRPLVHRSDVEVGLHTRLLGTVTVHASDRWPPEVHRAAGLMAVARELRSAPYSTLVVVSADRDESVRRQLLVLLTVALAPSRAITLHAPAPVLEAVLPQLGPAPAAVVGLTAEPPPPLDILDMSALDLTLAEHGEPTGTLLALPYGSSTLRAQRLLAQYRQNEVCGVVIVDRRRGLRRRSVPHRGPRLSGDRPGPTGPWAARRRDARTGTATEPRPIAAGGIAPRGTAGPNA